jgi:hypothetical protein
MMGVSTCVRLEEASIGVRILTAENLKLSASTSSSMLEKCKGEGDRGPRALNIELPLRLLLLAASIDGH